MKNQVCLVYEYMFQQTLKIEVNVKGMENIKYGEKIDEGNNNNYYFKDLHEK